MPRQAFDPDSYPGPRAGGPVLVHEGRVHPLLVDGPLRSPVRTSSASAEPTAGIPALRHQSRLRWSVAYGSNASPQRLMSKGLDRRGAVLLPARLAGWEPAYEARRTGYGAVPLTLVPSPGAIIDTWVLGLLPDDLDELDRTEGRVAHGRPASAAVPADTTRHAPPGAYRLGRVGDVAVADRFLLADGLAYLPGASTRVQRTEAGWRTWPAADQAAARAGVTGRSAPAPDVAHPVVGPWPVTPLAAQPSSRARARRPEPYGQGEREPRR